MVCSRCAQENPRIRGQTEIHVPRTWFTPRIFSTALHLHVETVHDQEVLLESSVLDFYHSWLHFGGGSLSFSSALWRQYLCFCYRRMTLPSLYPEGTCAFVSAWAVACMYVDVCVFCWCECTMSLCTEKQRKRRGDQVLVEDALVLVETFHIWMQVL